MHFKRLSLKTTPEAKSTKRRQELEALPWKQHRPSKIRRWPGASGGESSSGQYAASYEARDTWLIAMLAAGMVVIEIGNPLRVMTPIVSRADTADRYLESLRTGNVDGFLSTLSSEARTKMAMAGRFTGSGPRSLSERRAAQRVLAQDHVDRYTRLGQHATENGSFVVYTVEQDAADGTHTTPLVVWLDRDGQVLRSTS
jgi:hypothetical protein